MSVIKKTLGRLALYYLLLAVNVISCANVIPDVFPTRNLSTVYLLFLSVCLIRYYSYRVSGSGALPFLMKAISHSAFFLLFLRGIKYGVFPGVDSLARHAWYLYYVPLLLMPLFLFCISLLAAPGEDPRIPKGWYAAGAVTAILILIVLTNDLHGLVFRFNPGFENWNGDYARAPLFYVITAWQYVLYLAAILILVTRHRIMSAKKYAWLTVIPFSAGIAMSVLLMTGTMPKLNGTNIVEFPEALIFMTAGVLECCMQIGLIPTNSNYGKLFGALSLSAQITDRGGKPVYLSKGAAPLTAEQFALADGERIGAHTVLHRMELPGGFGFWQDDVTELDRLNAELSEAKEGLAQETELIRLQNELREKEAKIRQRTAVYDEIARRTRRHSGAISDLARSARAAESPEVKEKCRRRITLFASFIKRYANLTLLAYENARLETGEVALSFSEVLRYLNFAGIPGELVSVSSGRVPSGVALALFEVFGALLLDNIDAVRGVFINLSAGEKTVCKLALENLAAHLPAGLADLLAREKVAWEERREDDVTYFVFTLKEGGADR
ncbi:MAG: hypothetical protein II776_00685 [Clostridia bacterium]|nr:hypothetical protein [Clostridia bacterium]